MDNKTPLEKYRAAHDPSRPLDVLPPAKRRQALVAIAGKIEAAANRRSAPPPKRQGPARRTHDATNRPRLRIPPEHREPRARLALNLVNDHIPADPPPDDVRSRGL